MSLKYEKIEPDAKRVVEGLRDTGYRFHTAVADIIDNSIAADATRVDVFLKQDFRGNVTLRIYDDGIGMDRDGLINALRYGSKQRTSKDSLGKFGLGLKTASTAFCRRLTVISRLKPSATLHTAIWDLDHVQDSGEWEVEIGTSDADDVKRFEEVLSGKRGTLVVWEKVDRLMKKFKIAGGAAARKAFDAIVDNPTPRLAQQGLKQHLATVYQRFLDPKDKRARNIVITLNGSKVEAWDPFCESVARMAGTEEVDVPVNGGSEVAPFRVRAFILPRREQFGSDDQAEAAKLSNDRQGIYVYRNNRLIFGPDWLGLLSKEPHYTLLRVEFSFDYRLDDAFQIDIKKSHIILDENIASFISDFLGPRRREANEAYRKGRKQEILEKTEGAHSDSNRNISNKESQIGQPSIKSLDAASGIATLVNRSGTVRLHLKMGAAGKKDEVHIQVVDTIDDGLLWEPALIGDKFAVRINRGHPYYVKVYVPNLKEGVTICGMDSLLWALSVAELNCVNAETEAMFNDLRYDVSRTLKKLVEDLPEPELDGDDTEAD